MKNIVILTGHLAADSERQTLASHFSNEPRNSVVNRLAVRFNYSEGGRFLPHTEWYYLRGKEFTDFYRNADYFKKGMPVIVSGELRVRPAPNGKVMRTIEVESISMTLLNSTLNGEAFEKVILPNRADKSNYDYNASNDNFGGSQFYGNNQANHQFGGQSDYSQGFNPYAQANPFQQGEVNQFEQNNNNDQYQNSNNWQNNQNGQSSQNGMNGNNQNQNNGQGFGFGQGNFNNNQNNQNNQQNQNNKEKDKEKEKGGNPFNSPNPFK